MFNYKLTILGCGGSSGVPSIDQGWGRCDSKNKKNYRTRTSAFLSIYAKENPAQKVDILFDVSPDFRCQALANKITNIDYILFTHSHADHIYGLDDIRSINRLMKKSINAYTSQETLQILQKSFHYIFNNKSSNMEGFSAPSIDFNIIDYHKEYKINNYINIKTTLHNHNNISTMGFVINNKIGYATDFKTMDNQSKESYKNLDLLVISCFTAKPHISHMTLDDTISLITNELKPKKAILTHMGVGIDYKETKSKLPKNIIVGFDNLSVEVKP